MAELEEKLNAILNDPQAMGQILTVAKALSGQDEENGASIEAGAFAGYSGMTICGVPGSYAEVYAKENNIPFLPDGAET